MLHEERTSQILRQAKDKKSVKPLSEIAFYLERDQITGDRVLQLTDGGKIRQDYISNSKPELVPTVTVPAQTPGLPGFTGQKPY
jgi:hypothetical protein